MDLYGLFARWLRGEIPGKFMPWQVDLDTTNICNQNCYYCNTADFRKAVPEFQPLDAYARLIEQLHNWRAHEPNIIGTLSNVIFSGGGEPTLLPGWETLVEQCIDCGFLVAMNTNGTNLDRLLTIPVAKLRTIAYIGVDIDSGNPETYERIRRSLSPHSPFEKVKRTAAQLGELGLNLDMKALLMPENTSPEEIRSFFQFARDVKARSVHLRPVVLEGRAFGITGEVFESIRQCEVEFGMRAVVAVGRYEPRQYKRCHQLFLFPSFSADGEIYLCCEYKGREDLCLGRWSDPSQDWRDLWCGDRHREIYHTLVTSLCKPCRPNTTNNRIEAAVGSKESDVGFI